MRVKVKLNAFEVKEVQSSGAVYDFEKEILTIPESADFILFQKWICLDERTFLSDKHIYIVESKCECYHCKNETPVFSFFLDDYYKWILNEGEIEEEDVELIEKADYPVFLSEVSHVDIEINDLLKTNYPLFFIDYDEFYEDKFYLSHCKNCGKPIPNFYTHSSAPNNGFFQVDLEHINFLIFEKIVLNTAVRITGNENWLSNIDDVLHIARDNP